MLTACLSWRFKVEGKMLLDVCEVLLLELSDMTDMI